MPFQLKKYFLTNLILLGFGVILSSAFSYLKKDNHLFILTLLGGLYTVGICSFLNLIYFLPKTLNKLRFILPGIISIIIMFIIFLNSLTELTYFETFAILNLLIGINFLHKK